jgi:hypothetical protein
MNLDKLILSCFILLAAVMVSCEKVLEVDPVAYIEEGSISSKTDAERLLIGCYDGLQQTGIYGRHMVIIPGLIADNLGWEGTTLEYGQVENNSILADNALVESIWNAHYETLNRINYLISKLPAISDLSESERADFNGQLYFLRALCHFNLVRFFGPVPIKTEPTLGLDGNLDPARDTEDAVYDRILTDLLAAEGSIQNTDPGFATNGAVNALLAKVYLERGQYDEAINYATSVITEYGYTLEPVYSDLFTQQISSEAIFVVLFNELDGNRLAEYFFPTSLNGRYEVAPVTDLIEAYESEDSIRFNASIAGDEPYCTKYPNLSTMANNVYSFRLSEVYLIRAEAEARNNGSVSAIQYDINQVRDRAGLADTEAATYEELLLAILHERRVELAFEGERWFDLLRYGLAIDLIESITGTDQLLLPVPLSELQANTNPGMYQNPGY